MCNPVAFAVAGAGQAMLGHIGQVQAASARNRNRARLYRGQQGEVYRQERVDISNFYLRGVDAEIKWAENAMAASRGLAAEQIKLNLAVADTLRATERDYVVSVSDARLAKAASRSGQTSKRIRIMSKAALGRAKAARFSKIDDAIDSSALVLRELAARRDAADLKAERMIGLTPQRGLEPLEPEWDRGPGLFSLFTNMAVGAASGYLTAKGAGLGVEKVIEDTTTNVGNTFIRTGSGQGTYVQQNTLLG